MTDRIKSPSPKKGAPQRTALLLGAGFVAKAMIAPLKAQNYHVIATNRDGQDVAGADQVVKFDGAVTPALTTAFETAYIILSSIPPKAGADPALSALSHLSPRADWIGYLSATSVYGDRGGNWAFEDEWPTPSLDRGKARAEAEIAWIETGWPVHIFRLAGIYGAGRDPFEKIAQGKARAVIKPGHVVNRIHIDDIISALLASIDAPNPQRIYNIADGRPAPPQDVLNFAADLIKAAHPKDVSVDSDEISDMARTFYAETKKIDITRAKRELSWSPQYPSYQDGLKAILAQKPYGKE